MGQIYNPDTISIKWYTVTKSFSDFQTAGLTNNINIISLPA